MLTLSQMTSSHEALAEGLKENAGRHRCYGMYTSMERALNLLLSGNLYVSNGQTWNDIPDRDSMKANNAYGLCFSCSTVENIAMWMLYSGNHGRSGALILFPPAVMQEILNAPEAEIGSFLSNGEFEPLELPLRKSRGDFDIFLTDVVYTDYGKEKPESAGTVILSRGEDHIKVSPEILKGPDVFSKHYAWSYEKECRLIIRLWERWADPEVQKRNSVLRIKISEKARRTLTDRGVRSPIIRGSADFGKVSMLYGKVDWDI